MLTLGIETSCDETAAALVRDGVHLVASRVATQVEVHRVYGGVVPEVASRHHLERLDPLVEALLAEAGVGLRSVDAVAVTRGPGLVGALMVGVSYAKALAFAIGRPLVGVNHVLAHVYAAFLAEGRLPSFPTLALVVSGGHTDLILLESPTAATVLGRSRDDAAGEAFDKVARAIGLPYPGGPRLEALAAEGERGKVVLPDVRPFPNSLDFSFSGIKTAAARLLEAGARPADVALAFQEKVVELLARGLEEACRKVPAPTLVLAGGVAANRRLRARVAEVAASFQRELLVPPAWLCTDNAAMVAAMGHYLVTAGVRDGWDLGATAVIHPFKP